MKFPQSTSNVRLFAALAVFAGVCVAWQLIGLRYTNHDDIYWNLYSKLFAGSFLDYASGVAFEMARVVAFVNMPIVLWADGASASPLYDVVNIGSFAMLYASFTWMFAKIGTLKDSLAVTAITLLLFPLHYYFTFPQGYPVIMSWGLAFAFLSSGLLACHLQRPDPRLLLGSNLLFMLSLLGSEYNFVLHPALLLLVLLMHGNRQIKKAVRVAWPYMAGWLLVASIYLLFSIAARHQGGDLIGRVTVGFDFLAWIKTFLTLEQKAFLPFALWGDGVRLLSATAQGAPEIATSLTWSVLWQGTEDLWSVWLVFSLTFVFFATIFLRQTFPAKSLKCYSIFFVVFATLPNMILACSSLYQLIVLKGFIQGHLTSFYAQMGLSALAFLACVYFVNAFPGKFRRPIAIVSASVLLAGFATVTFIYNNVNRQVMSANMQKWEAVKTLASFVGSDRPDLRDKHLAAPALWTISGVSVIPTDTLHTANNFWTEYVQAVLHTPLVILDGREDPANDHLLATYFATPSGVPVVLLRETLADARQVRFSMVASRPSAGAILSGIEAMEVRNIALSDWKCAAHCVVSWITENAARMGESRFYPNDSGPTSLVSQFFLGRNGQFASPLSGQLGSLKISDWGPRLAYSGKPPAVREDGSGALWFKVANDANTADLEVVFDGRPAKSTITGPGGIAAIVAGTCFDVPGQKDIYLRKKSSGRIRFIGQLTVVQK